MPWYAHLKHNLLYIADTLKLRLCTLDMGMKCVKIIGSTLDLFHKSSVGYLLARGDRKLEAI